MNNPRKLTLTVLLLRLWRHITPSWMGQFGLLLVLMIAASLAEMINEPILYSRST